MAKSLKSVLKGIKFVDVVVVLVFVAGMMCLMKKMDVVEGLCVTNQNSLSTFMQVPKDYWTTRDMSDLNISEESDSTQVREAMNNLCQNKTTVDACGLPYWAGVIENDTSISCTRTQLDSGRWEIRCPEPAAQCQWNTQQH
jgi:hypothetical protein